MNVTRDFNEDLENNPQRQFRILLERAYCWSSPINIQDKTLISTILLGMNVFDICLALEYYGIEALREALDSGVGSGFIRSEYREIIEIQIDVSNSYLKGDDPVILNKVAQETVKPTQNRYVKYLRYVMELKENARIRNINFNEDDAYKDIMVRVNSDLERDEKIDLSLKTEKLTERLTRLRIVKNRLKSIC